MASWAITGPAAPVVQSVLGAAAGSVGQLSPDAVAGTNGMPAALDGIQAAFARLFGNAPGSLPRCPLQPPSFGAASIPPEVTDDPMQFLQGLQTVLQQLTGEVQAFMQQLAAEQAVPAASDTAAADPAAAAPAADPSSVAPASDPANAALAADPSSVAPLTNAGTGAAFSAEPTPATPAAGATSTPIFGALTDSQLASVDSGDFSFLDSMQQQLQTLMLSQNPSDQIRAQMLANELNRIMETITSLLEKQNQIITKIAQNIGQ